MEQVLLLSPLQTPSFSPPPRRWPRGILAAGMVAWWVSGACVPDFAPASELGERPQVLALRAEPPETVPGGEAHLEALIHAPGGPLHLAWIACYADPAGWRDACASEALREGAALLACDGTSRTPVCLASEDATALVPVPPWLVPVIPDDEGRPVESVVHVTLVASVAPDPLTACWEALVEVRPTEVCLFGHKRLRVSERNDEARNVNPRFGPLEVNGAAVEPGMSVVLKAGGLSLADLAVSLSLTVDPATVDEAVDSSGNPDKAFLELRWFTDCGGFSRDSARLRCDPLPGAMAGDPPDCEAEETRWKPGAASASGGPGGSGNCAVHAVLSDGRGGVGYLSQTFLIQP